MLKCREMVFIALAVSAFWIAVIVLQSDTYAYVALRHIGELLHASEGMITALATIAIAAFTLISSDPPIKCGMLASVNWLTWKIIPSDNCVLIFLSTIPS